MIMNYIKANLFLVLKYAPGELGNRSAERLSWARRKIRINNCKKTFQKTIKLLNRNSVCVDLGANVGEITEILLQHAGRVYAFEPEPWAFAKLKERVGTNPRAFLYNDAIGSKDGEVALFRHPEFSKKKASRSQATSIIRQFDYGVQSADQIVVKQIDICKFLQSIESPIDLLKIDIEGAEISVLNRLIESPEINKIRAIFVETHELQMPELRHQTELLRKKIQGLDLGQIHFDWQ